MRSIPFLARRQRRVTSRAASDVPQLLAAFRQGLNDAGFVEGQNVAIEYRFAENRAERLPALAAELVQRRVSVIAMRRIPLSRHCRAFSRRDY
jgi:hypothetical protein